MGLIDDIKGIGDDLDTSEEHVKGHGFDTDVCEGCPHKEGDTVQRCGLCGCPLFNLDLTSSPPAGCPRLDQHEGE